MSKTICLTYIHSPFWGTDQFLKSAKEVGIEVYNCWPEGEKFRGHGKTIEFLYNGLRELKKRGYDKVIYADAADSYFVKAFEPPDDMLIYSGEKAYYPACEGNYRLRYPTGAVEFPEANDQWRFLNAGGHCAPLDLIIEIWEKTGFINHKGDINGQHEQHKMFWEAKDMGYPVKIDTQCELFQTTGFEHNGDFSVYVGDYRPYIKNNHTGTIPCLLHGNGRTPMKWLYDLYK